jgi:hypothetical protein
MLANARTLVHGERERPFERIAFILHYRNAGAILARSRTTLGGPKPSNLPKTGLHLRMVSNLELVRAASFSASSVAQPGQVRAASCGAQSIPAICQGDPDHSHHKDHNLSKAANLFDVRHRCL